MSTGKSANKVYWLRYLIAFTAIADLGTLTMFNPGLYTYSSSTSYFLSQHVGASCGIFVTLMFLFSGSMLVLSKTEDQLLRRTWALLLAVSVLPVALFLLAGFWSLLREPQNMGYGQG